MDQPHSAATTPPPRPALRWDLFCRVIDNFGDIGVCWRLARQLVAADQAVRLWVDDPRALAWMAPGGTAPVELIHWGAEDSLPDLSPGDVVVETFGCDPPEGFVQRMRDAVAAGQPAPVWINLEYLSAEPYVERSHGLRSPQPGGLDKWFFYPGFTPATGGLLREPALPAAPEDPAWLTELGVPAPALAASALRVSVFCYPQADLARLAHALVAAQPGRPIWLLTAPGAATELAAAGDLPDGVHSHALPWLPQAGYDRLLRSCALNLVRGEDSFVRAQWAGQPFLWHIYPQHDGVHAGKLDAFLSRHLRPASPRLAHGIRAWMQRWNGLAGPDSAPPPDWPDLPAWQALTRSWRAELLAQADLLTQLFDFVNKKR